MPTVALLVLFIGPRVYEATRPPARYDHAHRGADVRYVSHEEALRLCGPAHPRNTSGVIACAFNTVRPCVIVIGPGELRGVLRHEEGHCNGWSANHEP
jgi:hypothetical protein